MDDTELSDSRRVDYVLYTCRSNWHEILLLQADLVHLSFKTVWMILNGHTVGGLTVPKGCIHHMISYCRLAQCIYPSNHYDDIEWSDSRRVDCTVSFTT